MIASLPYTPIKCEYNYSKEDFEGHTKYVHKEIIIGIVPENPNVSMETIEEDGIIREYYTSDVYIFTGIYPEIGEQVCGKQQSLEIDEIHCHHKKPVKDGGTDEYRNLVIVHKDVHHLIHAKDDKTIEKYVTLIEPNKNQLAKINKYRKIAKNPAI